MSNQTSTFEHSGVACPFCGLACDDLQARSAGAGVRITANGCSRSISLFERDSSQPTSPAYIQGEPADLVEAVGHAGKILSGAAQPVISGLATDVAGVRAALELADRIGAVVDHMGSHHLFKNLLVLQNSGWMTTTFAEIRNRADLIIIAGGDVVSRFPRFFERVVWGEGMFTSNAEREIVFLGKDLATSGAMSPDGRAPRVIPCRKAALGEVFKVLRGIVSGARLQAEEAGGVPVSDLQKLAQRMREAKYGVIVWAAADLDFPHAELTIQAMSSLVTSLNEHTRFAALPLGGNDADITANQVCVWQSGFPLRTSFAGGVASYDPYHFSLERMLESGDADALLWVSSFDPGRAPPETQTPTIVLGRPGMQFAVPPAVYINVATPGLHHAGHFFRGDSVVVLRLRKLVDSPLPAVSEVVQRIVAAL